MPRMPIRGRVPRGRGNPNARIIFDDPHPVMNPRLGRAFPRIPVAEGVQLNPQDDRMAAILAAFQGMFGEPEMPIQDLSMLRAQRLAARQPIGEYDELGTLPDELRGINPARRNIRAAMNMKPRMPKRSGLRYFGE